MIKEDTTKKVLYEHIYIHVPYCQRKCGYCSFYSEECTTAKELETYLCYLEKEIYSSIKEKPIEAKTVYFGGGTPSLINGEDIERILSNIPITSDCEITMELNPADVTKTKAQSWKTAGVNRVSLGCQSFIPDELLFLGRRQSVEDNLQAFKHLRDAGFDNISLDLIYGLPNQSNNDLHDSLSCFCQLNPEHISTYCLSLAKDCRLAKWRNKLPSEDETSEMYFIIINWLKKNGWYQYELSNFCLSGKESQHNLAYWRNKYYLGFGPSAAGYVSGMRYKNPADIGKWEQQIDTGKFLGDLDRIDQSTRQKEEIILSLRTKEGLNLKTFKEKYNVDIEDQYQEILVRFTNLELLEIKKGWLRLTEKAYFISNEILKEFI